MASPESDCRAVHDGFLILSLKTWPKVSAYGPDYLFQTVLGVWEITPLNRVKLKTYKTDHRQWHWETVPSGIESI